MGGGGDGDLGGSGEGKVNTGTTLSPCRYFPTVGGAGARVGSCIFGKEKRKLHFSE